jgi:hypothetical protein
LQKILYWQSFDSILDPRHTILGRKSLAAGIIKLQKQSKKLVNDQIHQAVSKPNIKADIWIKSGMASYYYE